MAFHCHRCDRTFPNMTNDCLALVCDECKGRVLSIDVVGDTIVQTIQLAEPLESIRLDLTLGDST